MKDQAHGKEQIQEPRDNDLPSLKHPRWGGAIGCQFSLVGFK